MSTSDTENLNRLRAAQIPPHAYPTSLRKEKQNNLANIINGREFELGPAGLISYRVTHREKPRVTAPSVSKVCAVFAKELALLKRSVYYTSIAEIAQYLRTYDKALDSPMDERLGKGYIVVGEINDNVAERPAVEWQDIQMFLLSHIGRGGGLVLGIGEAPVVFSSDFADALSQFALIEVE